MEEGRSLQTDACLRPLGGTAVASSDHSAVFSLVRLVAHVNHPLKCCMQHSTPTIFFSSDLTKKKGIIWIHLHWTITVVLAVAIFFSDNLKEKGSMPLIK